MLVVVFAGSLSMALIQRPIRHLIVCEAAPQKKADSAEKRARQAEKRRVYNKARKSEIKTRMKKVATSKSFVYGGRFVYTLSTISCALVFVSFFCLHLHVGKHDCPMFRNLQNCSLLA